MHAGVCHTHTMILLLQDSCVQLLIIQVELLEQFKFGGISPCHDKGLQNTVL